MRITYTVRLREKQVEVEGNVQGPEPDVGIMNDYLGEYTLRDTETGDILNWELTPEEEQIVQNGLPEDWWAE